MYIEDLLLAMISQGAYSGLVATRMPPVTVTRVNALCRQITQNLALTLSQREYALRVIRRYRKQLSVSLNMNIERWLDHPQYRLQLSEKSTQRYAKISSDGMYIDLFSPYDASLVTILRNFKSDYNYRSKFTPKIHWDQSQRVWKLPFREEMLVFFIQQLQNQNINFSTDLQLLLDQTKQILQEREQWTPVMVYESGNYVYKNASDCIPINTATTLTEALIQAKFAGVEHLHESVAQKICHNPPCAVINDFLNNYGKSPTIVSAEFGLDDLSPLVKQMKTWLVIVPYFGELKAIQTVVDTFSKLGISANQTSVLFRLSNKTQAEFNQYIKNCNLNNKLGSDTRLVFIRDRIPKSLVSAGIDFDAVLCLNEMPQSYYIRNYIQAHPCVIKYRIQNKNLELKF